MELLVSAIITTHNRKELLKRAIESVFAQSYSPIELIVVDDHSEDGTSEVCQDPRIRYIYIPKEESRGGNYARNLGVKAAKGEYCAFLDDDDYWLPTKIEKQVELLNMKQCSLVYCLRVYQIVSGGQVIRTRNEDRSKPSGDLSDTIFKHYITSTSCILASKAVIEEVGGFDEDLRKWQEYDLMIRMAQKTHIYYVDEYLCLYRADVFDPNRISNDYGRITETIQKFKIKYADKISKLPIKVRLYFFDMCVGDTYLLAKRCGIQSKKRNLFLPYLLLNLFKSIDDRDIAKRNILILKRKLRSIVEKFNVV